MNLKQIQQEYIFNHPTAVGTGKSRSQLTFRNLADIYELAFISPLFTIADGEIL